MVGNTKLNFAPEVIRSFDPIAAIPSNIQAIESALAFGTGQLKLLALEGPSGWGKTRLLEAATRTMRFVSHSKRLRIISGRDWRAGLSSHGTPGEPLLLDDLEDELRSARERIPLIMTLERRAKCQLPTMVAFNMRDGQSFSSLLPLTRHWTVVRIDQPGASERVLVVNHLAQQTHLVLSDSLIALIARRVEGSGRSIEAVLKRLKLVRLEWLSDVDAIRACGLLQPFFRDNGDWDLRMEIHEAAQRIQLSEASQDIEIFCMRHWANLPEHDVADFFGIDARGVFNTVRRFRERLRQNPQARAETGRFAAYLVDRLCRAD